MRKSDGANLEKKEKLRKQILNSSAKMFFKRGFSDVKMDDISAEFSISKKTLYKMFSSKAALFGAAVRDSFERRKNVYENIWTGKSGCVDKLLKTNDYILHLSVYLTESFMKEIQRNAPELWKEIEDWRKDIIFNRVSSLIEEGTQKKIFKTDFDKKLALILYYELVTGLINTNFSEQYPSYSSNDLSKAIGRLFFVRIVSEDHRRLLKKEIY